MNSILNILLKSVVAPFYRSHAGLLIFVFLVMFGTVESNQLVNYHRSLIEGMFASGVFMTIVCSVWTLYSLKILQFMISLLRDPNYTFLNHFILLSKSNAIINLLLITSAAFLPVIGYSIFIYQAGISEQEYFSCIIIALFQITLCCFNAFIILFFLRTQHRFTWSIPKLQIPNLGGRIGFYVFHLVNEEKIALLISKGFSLGLLYIVRETSDVSDEFRILGLTWVFVLLGQTFFIPKIKAFEDRCLTWIKGLPITNIKTCLLYFLLYTGLMLPELIFSITLAENVIDLLQVTLLSGALLMFVHAYLTKPNRNPDQYSTFLFWLFITSFLAVLSKLLLGLIVVIGVLACINITRRYYQYEPNSCV